VFIAAAIAIILGNRQGAGATASAGTAPKVKAATARRS
jgi:hypothetical protein